MAIDFNLTHLRYFYDAAHLGSVGLAAKKNFVTSSTISQAIKKLEENLSVDLLHHKKREFRPTDEGNRLLSECEKIFLSIKNFENEIQSGKSEPSGELRFASSHSIVSSFLLDTIARMRKKFPQIMPIFELGKTSVLIDLLVRREVDFIITIDDGTLHGFDIKELYKGNFVIIESSRVGAKSLPYLITQTRPETQNLEEHYRKKHAGELPVLFVLDSWELIFQAVSKGIGLGLVPDYILLKHKNKNVVPSKPNFKYPYRLVAVTRKNETLSQNTKIFLELVSGFPDL